MLQTLYMWSVTCANATSIFHFTTVSMKPVECTTVPTSATTNCRNYSRNVWLEELAEKWLIILKNCSMLGDTYNAQKILAIFIWAYLLRCPHCRES